MSKSHYFSIAQIQQWTRGPSGLLAGPFMLTHVAQVATPSAWGTQGSFSSSSGHSWSLAMGNCLMLLVRTREPVGDAVSRHVSEHRVHSDHSDTWHSLVITQDWKVTGSFSCWQKLQKNIDALVTYSQLRTRCSTLQNEISLSTYYSCLETGFQIHSKYINIYKV